MKLKQLYNKYRMVLGNIVYMVCWIIAIENGYGILFMLASSLILGILYRKKLWAIMKFGGSMYESKSRELGDKLYEKVNRK